MRCTRHTLLTTTTIGAAVIATLLPAGCSSSGGGCTSQNLTVQNVVLSSITAAFDIHAAAQSPDGKPLSGVPVAFWAWGRPPGQTASVRIQLGTASTDASGRAILKMPPIIQDNVVSTLDGIDGTTFVKVSADGMAGTVNETPYCEGKGSAPVTCGSAGQTCAIVKVPRG